MPTVAILGDVDVVASMETLSGVRQFAETKPGWTLIPLHYTQEPLLGRLIADRGVDGAIGSFLSDRWVAGVARHGVPLINASNLSRITRIPSVAPDDAAIGRLAAEHLLTRDDPGLAFAGRAASAYSQLRQSGFVARCAAAARQVEILPECPLTGPRTAWQDWLRQTNRPRPLAVFCADDRLARSLIQVCRRLNLAVPGDVAVMGVGDSALDAFLAQIAITSAPLPHQQVGYRAAELLHRAMQGQVVGPTPIRIPPPSIMVRASTLRDDRTDPLVRRATAFIDANLDRTLRVEDVATHLHASARLLELRFKEALRVAPRAWIRARRIARAQHLLGRHNMRIAEVAAACGYTELSHFYHAFKAVTGATPAAFRVGNRQSNGAAGIRHVIWDWNGTLLDDVEACIAATNRMLLARGLPPVERKTYREVFDFPVSVYYRRLGFQLDHEDWDALAREYHAHYAETARTAPLHAGAIATVEALERAAIGMSILSACETTILVRMLEARGIQRFFTHVRGVDNLDGASKLDQGRALMQDLAIDPAHVVLVGDTCHDVEVANALGCAHILIAAGHQHRRRLEACASRIVDSAAELPAMLLTAPKGYNRSAGS
jgi:phosphoglycolate phosphatase-like HAD superfamily hydrolase/DNA-binding LacI/PurR family transcriptional regulator